MGSAIEIPLSVDASISRLPYMDAIRRSTGHSERRPNGVRRSPSVTHTPQRILRGSNFFELLVKVS